MTTDADLPRACADALEGYIRQVLADQDRCVLASAGGSTPVGVFAALGGRLDDVMDRLVVTVVDERHVGTADRWQDLPDASNTRLLYSAWLADRPVAPEVVSWARSGTLGDAARTLDAMVPTPDVLLLGMGPDGHIASLFPGHPALAATDRVLAVPDSPKPPPERLTMSLPLLRQARFGVLLITGAAKRDAARRIHDQDPSHPFVQLTAPGGPVFTTAVDDAAGPPYASPGATDA
jgi:6-phosphogluconolactonase